MVMIVQGQKDGILVQYQKHLHRLTYSYCTTSWESLVLDSALGTPSRSLVTTDVSVFGVLIAL